MAVYINGNIRAVRIHYRCSDSIHSLGSVMVGILLISARLMLMAAMGYGKISFVRLSYSVGSVG